MDASSIIYYVLALFVAMVLLGVLLGQRRREVSSTAIAQMNVFVSPDGADGTLRVTSLPGERVLIERCGMWLQNEETVNLVATITGSRITIVEKKGMTSVVGAREQRYNGEAVVDFIAPRRVKLRYESQVTGQWTRLTFTNVAGRQAEVKLSY